LTSGQLSAGVSAAKEMSILAGKRIERSEIGLPGEFDAMQDTSWSAWCATGSSGCFHWMQRRALAINRATRPNGENDDA
jgi:hypothetical protein